MRRQQNVGRVAILLVARDLAGAAADALRHVEVEAILFACRQRPAGNKQRKCCGSNQVGKGHRGRSRRLRWPEDDSVLGQPYECVAVTIDCAFVEW